MPRNYYSEINFPHCLAHKNQFTVAHADCRTGCASLFEETNHRHAWSIREIGGTETHVHLAVSFPPTLTPSQWMGELKGGSAHDVNQQMGKRKKVVQGQPVTGSSVLERTICNGWFNTSGTSGSITPKARRMTVWRELRNSRVDRGTVEGSSQDGEKARKRA